MEMKIMYDDIEVAYQRGNTFYLNKNISRKFIPIGLFVQSDMETEKNVKAYFCNRIFPKERTDCKEMLKSLGLKIYNPWQVVLKTNGTLYTDSWWLKVHSSDSYYHNMGRGLLGLQPISKTETTA
jgi:hypothetical protein